MGMPAPIEVTPPTVETAGRGATHDFVVETLNLTKQFGDEVAVRDVTFRVPRGTIFGFIGPSGSGKTTTVRLLTGIHKPTSGEARVFDTVPAGFSRKARQRIGYMLQHSILVPDLSVWENLDFLTSVYGVTLRRTKRLNSLLEFVELEEHKNKLVRNLSGGMQRRLSLAATLVHDPELLFLDEPTAGIDPVLRRKFWDHFQELQSQGHTLFVTTQYVGEAAYCDMVGVMAEGRLLMVDTPDNLRRRAIGGEAVELRTVTRLDPVTLGQLRDLPYVTGVSRVGKTDLQILVDDASRAMPDLVEWFRTQHIEVEAIQQYLLPFDDVFVELMKQNGTIQQ